MDLCLSSPDLSPLIEMKHQKDLGSDHGTVQIDVGVNVVLLESEGIPRWKVNTSTAKLFNGTYLPQKIIAPADIDTLVEDLTERITEAANLSFGKPKFKSARIGKQTPWWSEACYEAVHNRRKARRIAEKHPTSDNLQDYRRLSAIAKYIYVKRPKKIHYKNSCQKLLMFHRNKYGIK